MLSWVNWLDDAGDSSLLSLWIYRCCALWFRVLVSLFLKVLCLVFFNDIFCSGDDTDSPSCWVDWIWNCLKNHQILFGILIGSYVGKDKLDTLELSSLASMCDGICGSILGSWLKLEFIVFCLFFLL